MYTYIDRPTNIIIHLLLSTILSPQISSWIPGYFQCIIMMLWTIVDALPNCSEFCKRKYGVIRFLLHEHTICDTVTNLRCCLGIYDVNFLYSVVFPLRRYLFVRINLISDGKFPNLSSNMSGIYGSSTNEGLMERTSNSVPRVR